MLKGAIISVGRARNLHKYFYSSTKYADNVESTETFCLCLWRSQQEHIQSSPLSNFIYFWFYKRFDDKIFTFNDNQATLSNPKWSRVKARREEKWREEKTEARQGRRRNVIKFHFELKLTSVINKILIRSRPGNTIFRRKLIFHHLFVSYKAGTFSIRKRS